MTSFVAAIRFYLFVIFRWVFSLPIHKLLSVLHNWCNKDIGMYYNVCGMVHIKDTSLLTVKIIHEVMAADFLSRV